jgi:deoxyadenosine/deoxycytidine kinase
MSVNRELLNKHGITEDAVIVVAGVVGIGKSTISEAIAERLGFTINREVVNGNPYLEKFYADQKQWSFHLQIFFLAERFKDLRKAFEQDGGCLYDRSIYEDTIFAKMLHDDKKMTDEEYGTYKGLFKAMVYSPYFVHPDLIIYLDGDRDTVIERIKRRGRGMELSTPVAYWDRLKEYYEE